ncbi:MAG: DUF3857 domain-containing protein, partial [Bacteroidales bacterium]|nr:DUF3857 domain-containing protein [Bacteroidales bacterium]
MRKYILSISIILFAAFSFAQTTDAVFKKIKKTYTLNVDGTSEYRYQKELQLNSQYAFNRLFGETFVIYNPDYEYVKIHHAYTIMANGRKVEVPENAFNKVLPRAAANYPAYNQMIELVITHTALEVGATIFLDYSIISKPQYIKELMGIEILQESVAVDNYEIVLKVPARRLLNYSLLNADIKPKEENDGTYRTYTWLFNEVKAQSYEQASPKGYDLASVIEFSTFSDTRYEFDAFVSQQAFKKSAIKGLEDMIKECQKNTNSELALALEIQKYIVNNISTKHIPLTWHNYQIQTPKQVWDANVGSEVEKANLLWQALDQIGLNTDLVALYPFALYHEKQADLENTAAFGVLLELKDGTKLILSASENNPKSLELSHPDCVVLSLKNAAEVKFRSSDSLDPKLSLIQLKSKITIDPNNDIYGDMTVRLRGAQFDYIALQQDTQRIKRYISNPPPFAKEEIIEAHYIDAYNGQFELKIKGDAKLKNQENYYFWSMPYVNNGIAAKH